MITTSQQWQWNSSRKAGVGLFGGGEGFKTPRGTKERKESVTLGGDETISNSKRTKGCSGCILELEDAILGWHGNCYHRHRHHRDHLPADD
jgi:hypothetical protein